MNYLIGIIGLLLGGLYLSNKSKQSAEALLDNAADKDKIRDIQSKKDVNNANLEVEEQKRKDAENAAQKTSASATDSELADSLTKK